MKTIKLIALSISSAMIFTLCSPITFAKDDLPTIIATLSQKCQALNDDANINRDKYKQFIELLEKCKIEIQEYIDDVNVMFDGVLTDPKGKTILDVERNIRYYLSIISKRPTLQHEALFLQQVLEYRSQNHKKLITELDDSFKALVDSVENPAEKIELSEIHNDVSKDLGSSIIILKDVSKVTDKMIVQQIVETMKNPNEANVTELTNIFNQVEKKYQLNIFKHLLYLSNNGNPFASQAIEKIRPDIKKEPFTRVLHNAPRDEEINAIIKQNTALDQEYNNTIHKIYTKHNKDAFFCEEKYSAKQLNLFQGAQYPIRTDILNDNYYNLNMDGDYIFRPTWAEFLTEEVVDHGWKLHITAQPSGATKIAKIAVPIIEKMQVPFKITCSLNRLRFLNSLTDKEYSTGKFIAIYPSNDKIAYELAKALDEAFIEAIRKGELHSYDFFELLGDAMVGHSGAVYTRYGGFVFKSNIKEQRRVPLSPSKYTPDKSPFKELPVRFLFSLLPDDNCNKWILDTEEVQQPLLTSDTLCLDKLSK